MRVLRYSDAGPLMVRSRSPNGMMQVLGCAHIKDIRQILYLANKYGLALGMEYRHGEVHIISVAVYSGFYLGTQCGDLHFRNIFLELKRFMREL